MVAKFRAMSNEDYANLGTKITTSANYDNYDHLHSKEVSMNGVMRSNAGQHVRKVIDLCFPTFNYVLARSRAGLLRKLLNVKEKMWDDIVNCNIVMSMTTGEFVHINDVSMHDSYLFGAQIAEKMIKELNIEEELISCIYDAFSDMISSRHDARDFFKINRDCKGKELTAGFYVDYDPLQVSEALKRGRDFEDLITNTLDVLFSSHENRFTLLLNMNKDKSGLYGMLNYSIAVVPEEMRPKVQESEHKLSARYASVIKANIDLKLMVTNNSNPKDIRAKYRALDLNVSKLQYSNVGSNKNAAKDDLAILERIKSKKGQVRMHNLGKRQDYSGRAVVTVDPFLPIDTTRIPKAMAPKLYEYHLLPYLENNKHVNVGNYRNFVYENLNYSNLDNRRVREEMLRLIKEHKIAERVGVALGRQPTLHKQSIQGFRAELTDSQVIEVSPLVCPAFNMDFDGDQGHVGVPLSKEAVGELNDLMLTTQNIFLAKNGECTIEPRQEMLYGLYVCTNENYKLGEKKFGYVFKDLDEVRDWVMKNKVPVDATISVVSEGGELLAGEAAFMSCFKKGDLLPSHSVTQDGRMKVKQVTSKTITDYIEYILRTDANLNRIYSLGSGRDKPGTFVGTVNHLVELGFKVARIYTASMSLLKIYRELNSSNIEQFYEDMKDIETAYGLGLTTKDNYQIEFDKHLKKLDDTTQAEILKSIGSDSGYTLLSVSGARGSKSNLIQSFAHKGRVKKNSSESFNALIVNSYASQMTPLEHTVDAYGGRQGQMDKSLKTGDTGYAMRQMWHTTQGFTITNEDCGTNEGLVISKDFLMQVIETPDSTGEVAERQIKSEVSEIFEHVLIGRYKVGSNKMITKAEAKAWANDDSVESVTIRSPLYCKNPCCKKCYGMDFSSRREAIIGFPAGIIAAQSIGEPGAQLTMKQFQVGGVAGKAEFNSAFDKVNKYCHIANLKKDSEAGNYSGYDPIAWASGKIIEEPASDITKKIVKIEGSKEKILVSVNSQLKEVAIKGQGLSYKHGDYSIREIEKHSGIREAQRYLAFKLFYLYKGEVKLIMSHLEVLVACMTKHMIYNTDRSDLMIGQYASTEELYRGDLTGTKYKSKLISMKDIPITSNEGLDNILMENHSKGLSRACLLQLSDSLTKPLNRMIMGKSIKCGSAVPNFVQQRKEKLYNV